MDRLRRRIIKWLDISFADISGQATAPQIAPGVVNNIHNSVSAAQRTILEMEKTFEKMFDEHLRRESLPGGSMHKPRSLNDREPS